MNPYFWSTEETDHLRKLVNENPGRIAPVARLFQQTFPHKSYEAVKRKIYMLDKTSPVSPKPVRFPWEYEGRVIKEEVKQVSNTSSMPSTVLVISDLHAPFQHPDALDFLSQTYTANKCDRVVCIGDEIDFHRISRHPSEHDSMGAKDEFETALSFMRELFKMFPNVQVCVSNHTSRPYRMAHTVGVLDAFLKPYKEWMMAPEGWSWHDHFEIDGVLYFHGEPYTGDKGPLYAMQDKKQSVVIGHIHTGGGVWTTPATGSRFGLNVGCLIDLDAYAFRYGKAYRAKPTIGCGIVREGKWAEFVPLL